MNLDEESRFRIRVIKERLRKANGHVNGAYSDLNDIEWMLSLIDDKSDDRKQLPQESREEIMNMKGKIKLPLLVDFIVHFHLDYEIIKFMIDKIHGSYKHEFLRTLLEHQKDVLSEDFMEEIFDDFHIVSEYYKMLSEDQLRRLKDKIDELHEWGTVMVYSKLSESFILEFKDKVINYLMLSEETKVSYDFLINHFEEIVGNDIHYLHFNNVKNDIIKGFKKIGNLTQDQVTSIEVLLNLS